MEAAVSIKFQEILRHSVWTDRQTARWRSVLPNTVMELHLHQTCAAPIREGRLVNRNFKFNLQKKS